MLYQCVSCKALFKENGNELRLFSARRKGTPTHKKCTPAAVSSVNLQFRSSRFTNQRAFYSTKCLSPRLACGLRLDAGELTDRYYRRSAAFNAANWYRSPVDSAIWHNRPLSWHECHVRLTVASNCHGVLASNCDCDRYTCTAVQKMTEGIRQF